MRCPEYSLIKGKCKALILFENENGLAVWMKRCGKRNCGACKGNVGDDVKEFLPSVDVDALENGDEIRIVARIEHV